MKTMNNDRGFTLIELIVVMIIVGILALGSISGIKILNRDGVKSTAERISTVLNYIQMENMTKSKSYSMVITKNMTTDKYELNIVTKDSAGVEQPIGTPEILELEEGEIFFQNYNDSIEYLVSPVPVASRQVRDELKVSFHKVTGGVKEDEITSFKVTRIGVRASGKTTFIRLVVVTGKHYIE